MKYQGQSTLFYFCKVCQQQKPRHWLSMKLPPARRWVTAFFLTNCLSSLPAFLVPSELILAFRACLQAGFCLWQSTGMEKSFVSVEPKRVSARHGRPMAIQTAKLKIFWGHREVNSLQETACWGTPIPCYIGVGQDLQKCKLSVCLTFEG